MIKNILENLNKVANNSYDKIITKAKEIGLRAKSETPHMFEEKLPPFATAQIFAKEIKLQEVENEVFVQREDFVKKPLIVVFFNEEWNEKNRKDFLRKLKRNMNWHEFKMNETSRIDWTYVFRDKNIVNRVVRYLFDNGNIIHEVILAPYEEKKNFKKHKHHFLQVYF